MNKLAKLLVLSGVALLSACSSSSDVVDNKPNPNPNPNQITEDQLRVLTSGEIPMLNGQSNTIDVILHNTSELPVYGAKFSLGGIENARITSANGCDKIISAKSDCRVSVEFKPMMKSQSYINQPFTVEYKNWRGNAKSVAALYTATRVSQTAGGPKIGYVSVPPVLIDVSNNHVRGVLYAYVNNPSNDVFSIKDASFGSGAFNIVSMNYSKNDQLPNGALIEIEYDAVKSESSKKQETMLGQNGGFSSLTITDSNNKSLTLGATSDYVTGSYLVAGPLNPLNSGSGSSTSTEELLVTNIGVISTTASATSSSSGVATVGALSPSTVAVSGSSSATVSAVSNQTSNNMSITVTGESNTITLPLTVYNGNQPSLLTIQPISYTFPSQSGVSPSALGQTQDVVIANNGATDADGVLVTFSAITTDSTITVNGVPSSTPYAACGSIAPGSTCVIPNVKITSTANQPNGLVGVSIAYTGGPSNVGGIIKYNSVERSSVAITGPASFSVVGNNVATTNTEATVYNTGTAAANRAILIEAWTMTNKHSAESWLYTTNNGSCIPNTTTLAPNSAESCTIALTLGPIDRADIAGNPQTNYTSQESMFVTFRTIPLDATTSTTSDPGIINFTVQPDNEMLSLQTYSATGNANSGADGANSKYVFLGSANGVSNTISLVYTNNGANNITITNVQHYNNPFYWIKSSDGCSNSLLIPTGSCTITYQDNLYANIAQTTQSGVDINNSLTLPGFVFYESNTASTFFITPPNPNGGSSPNQIFSNEAILFLNHIPIESSNKLTVNMLTQPQVDALDTITNYNFTEVTSINSNGLIESTGWISVPSTACSVAYNNGLLTQTCNGAAGFTAGMPYGVDYLTYNNVPALGDLPAPINITPMYQITSSGNQSISQNTMQATVSVK